MKKIKSTIIIIPFLFLIALFATLALNETKNYAIRLEEKIKTITSDITMQEKIEIELMNNILDIVIAHGEHVYTLEDIVNYRMTQETMSSKEMLTIINVIVETYPNVKSNQSYKWLSNELKTIENKIIQNKERCNNQIEKYNIYVKSFPNNQILKLLKYEIIDFTYIDC